jgi:Mg-chelatase subunit ChlD
MSSNKVSRVTRALTLGSTLTIAALGCGGGSVASPATPHAILRPLSIPITLDATGGEVEYRSSTRSGWSALAGGKAVERPTALRVKGDGAAFSLGTPDRVRGSLWLAEGSSIEIGEGEQGEISVLVREGKARIKVADTRVHVMLADAKETPASTDLVLLAANGRTEALATAEHLDAADWSLGIGAKKEPAGIGTLEPVAPPDGDSRDHLAPLAIRSLSVTARSVGDYAETVVDEVFENVSDRRLEGTFRYPFPEDALLVGLAMEIDGELMEGELVPRDKAREIFDEIVDAMRDPALLEWESGSMFKLRVFPIEPHADKRVVVRYVAPLHRAGDRFEYAYRTAAPADGAVPKKLAFHLTVDGKTIVDDRAFTPGRDLVAPIAPVPAAIADASYRERRADGVYTAVRVRPDWSKVTPRPVAKDKTTIVIVDTSRSALEEKKLTTGALRLLLAELRATDRFVVVASDVVTRDHAASAVNPTRGAVDAAVHFIETIEPDGASDLGAALRHAGALAARSQKAGETVEVVYIGDGAATWGETDPAELEKLANASLGGVPLHAMVLGGASDSATMRRIVGTRGGRLASPRTELQARRVALALGHASELRRIEHAHLVGDRENEKDVIFPNVETTLFEGDDVTALVKTLPGQPEPKALLLRGTIDGKNFEERLPMLASPVDVPRVAQRWARAQIGELDAAGDAKKDEAVKLSLAFGVMSRATSFLVLESEEAYAKYAIERRQAKRLADGTPKVSGGDLESVNARSSRLDPDHIQPGDPEVRIPAPADARSVTVTLPFGETKVATWEPELRAWTTRFLIDKDTPDGTYEVLVRITKADGAVEIEKLSYVVDTQKPHVTLSLTRSRTRPGVFDITATQLITEGEISHAIPEAQRTGSLDENRVRHAQILTDALRVEVGLPDGQVLRLTATRLGEFHGSWKPNASLTPGAPIRLRVVTADRALNEEVRQLDVTPQ